MITRSQARKRLSIPQRSLSLSPPRKERRRKYCVKKYTRVNVTENGVPILQTHYDNVYHKIFGYPSRAELVAFLR